MAVTIKQIAEQTGLSWPTVSQVLTGKGHRYKAETRERILKVARQLGYRPNAFARAIRTGRFGAAALVLSATDRYRSALPDGVLQGICDALEAKGMHLTVARLGDQKLTDEGFVPKLLREWMADGLLLDYNKQIPSRMMRLIEQYDIPSIWLNYRRQHDAVYPDDLSAGREATERLLALGHRRIAYAGQPGDTPPHYSETDRREGYAEAMRAAGLEPRVVGGYKARECPHCGRSAWRAVLDRPERPTAVVAYGAKSLLGVFRAADRLGLEMPRDLSLITFSGHPAGLDMDVATMLVPEIRLGREAVEMLLEKIESPERKLPGRAIAFGFDEGGSLAAPPEAS